MPTRAQVEAQWVNAATLLEQARAFGQSNAQNWVGLQQTYESTYNSDFVSQQAAAVAQARSNLASLISNSTAAALMTPNLKSYIRHIVNAENLTDAQLMLDRLYRYMVDNSLTVKARNFTFASPAAGANTGNGTILRLNTDEWGFSIENQHVDGKTARCVNDQNSGTAVGEESFDFYGQAPGPDALQVSGSGADKKIAGLSGRNSKLSNTSFDQFSGTASVPTAITSWSSNIAVNATNYTFDNVNFYRSYQGTTPYGLNVQASATLTQALSLFNTKLAPNVPYLLQLAWNRQVHAATGTLQINLGSQSNSVVAAAQTGWQLLIAPTAIGTNDWLKNFNQQNLTTTITWTQTGGTGLLIDDMLLVPATGFDGSWYWVIGGSTPFLKNDIFTWTDTCAEAALIQKWIWRAFGRWLPSTTGSPTWLNS